MQYKIGDAVRYGALGECKIKDVVRKNLCGTEKEYYVLNRPSDESTIYVPTDKSDAFKPILAPFTADDVNKLIAVAPLKIDWDENDAARQETFNEIWDGEDTFKVCALHKALTEQVKALKSNRKKPKQTIINAIKICEKILYLHLSRSVEVELDQLSAILSGEKPFVMKK